MYVRKRLDIGFGDLAAGLWGCLAAGRDPARARGRIEAYFAPPGAPRGAFACLSVRAGLDLYLDAVALPAGSEVLMSALTVPDMARIVEAHGLRPVPVDVDARTLAPTVDACRRAATPRTRALLLAHLLGTRFAPAPFVALCRERGWLLLEDCAQAFTGPDFRGDPAADVSMFSFGPIKTASALGGAVLCLRDADVLERMRAAEAAYPRQRTREIALRLVKYAGFKALSFRWAYGALVAICRWLGVDHDRLVHGAVRVFARGRLLERLRRRPAPALYRLLARRLARADGARIARRTALGRRLAAGVRASSEPFELPGDGAPFHSFWVFAVLAPEPEALVAELRAAGFDATRVSSLAAVDPPPDGGRAPATEARRLLAQLVFLPLYPELDDGAVDRMAALLGRRGASAAKLTYVASG